MGSTPSGADWCIKALHPSDPITEVRGIPDESAVPTTFMNYQSVYTVSPAAGAAGTWSLDGQLIPNPLSFGAALYTDSVGNHAIEFVNSQLPTTSHLARISGFVEDFSRWRLAYASVTIYQDGPDLANQGTVVVCQKPVEPARFNLYCGPDAGSSVGRHHAFHLDANDLPNYNASQGMPNAYFGRSRDGAYIPLKLTRTHQTWHSKRDLTYQATAASLTPYSTAGGCGSLSLASSVNLTTNDMYPFLSMNDVHHYTGGGVQSIAGDLTSDFCNENWADFSFRNLAVTTSLSFFFRFGFEVQVDPSSVMAPHLRLSPASDPQALATYYAISRELKDAYPADYNDLGKIWDVIKSVGKVILPPLTSMIPVVGPAVSSVMSSVMNAPTEKRVEEATKRLSQPTRGSTASQADVELVQEAKRTPRVKPRLGGKTVRFPKRR